MKAFDYEKAKNGHPLCTRNGKGVTIYAWNANSHWLIIGVVHSVHDSAVQWKIDGTYGFFENHPYDLMMKED